MKKLTTILLLMLFTGLSNAQTTKPTVEETVQYIKNELTSIHYRYWNKNGVGEKYETYEEDRLAYEYFNIEMESCIMEMFWNLKRYDTTKGFYSGNIRERDKKDELRVDRNYNVKIDFSRIEYISFGLSKISNSEENEDVLIKGNFVEINFKQKKDDGTYQNIIIPLGVYSADFNDFTSLKIYKAFEHLRKLCDAPEPISFD